MQTFRSSIMCVMMAVAALCVRSAPANPIDQATVAKIIDKVRVVAEPGSVGQIAVWGDDARAIATGKSGDTQRPLAAMATLGRGRIVAFAHGYASAGAVKQFDTAALLVNATQWLCGEDVERNTAGKSPLRVGLFKCDLEAFFRERGFESVIIKGDNLADELSAANVKAVVSDTGDLTDPQREAIETYIRRGGGFMFCACPWGWAQVRKQEVDAIPLNRILEKAGLAFTDGTVDGRSEGGFAIQTVPGDEFNASRALAILQEADAGTRDAKDPIIKQAGATLQHAAGVLPSNDRRLRPSLASLLQDRANRLVPTPDKPLRTNQALDRALLAMQVTEIERASPRAVEAHPSSAAFPGAVADDVPRITKNVTVNPDARDWQSTGLYAAPGEVISISLIGENARGLGDGWRVRIGCHKDQLWHHDRWQRVPRITQSWSIEEDDAIIGSAFGGLIYIEAPRTARAAPVAFRIKGAVESPLFVLGETSNEQWTSTIRQRGGPWAEFACERIIITVPSDVARRVDDPTSLMQHWVKVLDACADLATISRERTGGGARPERIVADVQISAGYMHSGYPIMTHLDAAAFMTDLEQLKQHGWGPYHELGHNHQHSDWTFDGTVEVTCNLFTLYVLEKVCGVPVAECGRVMNDKAFENMQKHFDLDDKWNRWKRDPFLALQMYALMQRDFGWDAFTKVFAEYRSLKREERPKNDDQKRDQWLVRFSKTVGRNLGPYFEAWGVPTSSEARQAISDLPVWLPKEMNP